MQFKNFGFVIAAMFLLAACESTSVEEGASTGTGAQSGGASTTSSSASGSGAGSMARASAIREGSPQDFVINVGDRVYYDLDKSNIRADAHDLPLEAAAGMALAQRHDVVHPEVDDCHRYPAISADRRQPRPRTQQPARGAPR